MATTARLRNGDYEVIKSVPALDIVPRDELVVDREDHDAPGLLTRETKLTPRQLLAAIPSDARRHVTTLYGGRWVIYEVLKPLPEFGARPGDQFHFHRLGPVEVCLYREFGAAALRQIPRHAVRPLPDPGESDDAWPA